MGCSGLNSLPIGYFTGRDLFYLHFEAREWDRLSMSAHSPRLQFVTRLLYSPKTEAKWVVLVKGSWYEMSGSPRLLFDLNQSLLFLGLSQLDGFFTLLGCLCFDMLIFFELFVGRRRRG